MAKRQATFHASEKGNKWWKQGKKTSQKETETPSHVQLHRDLHELQNVPQYTGLLPHMQSQQQLKQRCLPKWHDIPLVKAMLPTKTHSNPTFVISSFRILVCNWVKHNLPSATSSQTQVYWTCCRPTRAPDLRAFDWWFISKLHHTGHHHPKARHSVTQGATAGTWKGPTSSCNSPDAAQNHVQVSQGAQWQRHYRLTYCSVRCSLGTASLHSRIPPVWIGPLPYDKALQQPCPYMQESRGKKQ